MEMTSERQIEANRQNAMKSTAPYRPEFSGIEAQRELGQRRGADVGFRANTGRSVDPRWMSAFREEADPWSLCTSIHQLPAVQSLPRRKFG